MIAYESLTSHGLYQKKVNPRKIRMNEFEGPEKIPDI